MKLKVSMFMGMAILFATIPSMGEKTLPSNKFGRVMRSTNPNKHRLPSNVYIEYMVTDDGIQFFPSEVYNEADVTVTDATAMVVAEGKISEVAGYFIPGLLSLI